MVNNWVNILQWSHEYTLYLVMEHHTSLVSVFWQPHLYFVSIFVNCFHFCFTYVRMKPCIYIIYTYKYIMYVCIYGIRKKIMQQFVKFVHHFLIRQHTALLWFASGFLPNANMLHFHGKKHHKPWILAFYKTVHCGAAIKVWRTRWEKSGAHGAAFSSAAAACLLHSF